MSTTAVTTPLAPLTDHAAAPGDPAPVPASDAASTGSTPFPSGAVAEDHTRAFSITSFVLGIASVVGGWTFFAPVTGLVFGVLALHRGTRDRALALWGVWLNAAMLAIWALAVLAAIVIFGFGALAFTFGV
ncbi:DUF4190 domain-containing protein [Leucobacter sp. USHLN153]|uniref:DUF4190 domain-containing protein n=1 Tax=Leucobacter sp. USHLN153 TaxID=3081268 RepID=UPI003018079B